MNLFKKAFPVLISLLCISLSGCSSEEEQPDGMGGIGGLGGNSSGCFPAKDLLEGHTLKVTAEGEYFIDAPFGYMDTPTVVSIEMAPLADGGSCVLVAETQPALLPSSQIISTQGKDDFENQSYSLKSGSLRTLRMSSKTSACEYRKLVVAPECSSK